MKENKKIKEAIDKKAAEQKIHDRKVHGAIEAKIFGSMYKMEVAAFNQIIEEHKESEQDEESSVDLLSQLNKS